MSFPFPDKSVPVIDQATGMMTQAWYDYLKFGPISSNRIFGSTSTALAGTLGERIHIGPTQKALTSGVTVDVDSITLQPGDWEVSAPTQFQGIFSTTVTEVQCSISAVSGFMDNTVGYHEHWRGSVLDFNFTMRPGPIQVLITAPTTYYLVAQAIFSGGTYEAVGSIVARRF